MRIEVTKVAEVLQRVGPWRWPHFTPRELACKGSGAIVIETAFLDRLEQLRGIYGRPMVINSAYRSPAHNAAVSSTGTHGPHTTGRAVDVQVHGAHAIELVRRAIECGFTGIGLQQKGPVSSRFVHLDDLPGDERTPRPTVWTY